MLEMNAKEAREIADKVNHVDTHKIFIAKLIMSAANKGLYSVVYSHEQKLPLMQLQNWLVNLGYNVQYSNEGHSLHMNWMEKREVK